MKTIHARVEVTAERRITLQVPADVTPGSWDAVLVLAETEAAEERRRAAFDELMALPPLRSSGWPSDARFRREELYGDELPQ